MQTLQQDYLDLRIKLGLAKVENCTPEQNKEYKQMTENGENLPEDVFVLNPLEHKYVMVKDVGLNFQQKEEYIKLKKLNYIRVIRNCIIFLVIAVLITWIISLFFIPIFL